jgi:hypothetical protein
MKILYIQILIRSFRYFFKSKKNQKEIKLNQEDENINKSYSNRKIKLQIIIVSTKPTN